MGGCTQQCSGMVSGSWCWRLNPHHLAYVSMGALRRGVSGTRTFSQRSCTRHNKGPARLPASLHHSRWGCGGFVSPQDPKKHQQECSLRPRIQLTVGITQKELGASLARQVHAQHTCTEAHKHAQKQTRRVQSHSVDTHVHTADILKCVTAHMHVCTWQAHTCADTAEMVHKGSCCLSSAWRTISFWHRLPTGAR